MPLVPSKTIEKVGRTQMAALRRRNPDAFFALTGNDLNDLAVLANRMNYSFDDANEMRDWQNRINLMLSAVSEL
jgi:hypothetical protein